MNMNAQGKRCCQDRTSEVQSRCGFDLKCSKPLDPGIGNLLQEKANFRRNYRWSKAARDLVRANLNVSRHELSILFTKLERESGYPRWACWRFVRKMGLKAQPYHVWTASEQQRLLKLVDLHPLDEIAKIMRRSQSSIWHMLYRLGANAKMGRDSFTKYTLAEALHVRRETVDSWIDRGWLVARQIQTARRKRVVITAVDFCEFCRRHAKDVVGNRLSKERLDFVYHFVFPPSHTGLLPVRDAQKEQRAYETQFKEGEFGEHSPE